MSSAAVADAAPAPKNSKKLLIMILAALLILGGGGAAAFFMLKQTSGANHADGKKSAERKNPSVFAALDPFTVNLADPSRDHYLQIGLTYEVYAADVETDLKTQMPLLRSRVLLLLTSKSSEELASPEGKSKLAGDLVMLARAALGTSRAAGAQNSERGVVDVHFSSFIIQ